MTHVAILLISQLALGPLGEGPPRAPATESSWVDLLETELVDANLIRNHQSMERRLRGDWESPDSVALVYSSFWPELVTNLVATLVEHAKVLLLVRPDDRLSEAAAVVNQVGFRRDRLSILPLALDTVWVRDFGPLQVAEGHEPIWLNASYASRPDDDAAPLALAAQYAVAIEEVPENLEGGAVASNGAGLCAMTTEFFEGTGIDDTNLEHTDAFLGQLGCRLLVLLPALARDPNEHVDMFLQFTAADRAMLGSFDPVLEPEDAERTDLAASRLRRAAAVLGVNLRIDRVPTPTGPGGVYFTYINGLQVGEIYVAPQYDAVPIEEELAIYGDLSAAVGPQRRVFAVNADSIIDLNGALHCVTLGLFHRNDPSLSSYDLTVLRPKTRPRGTGAARRL